jgi:hypothetical protein
VYVPIGGQHISAALWHIWQEALSIGVPEDDIPDKHQIVQGELLISSTPGPVRALAAGKFQAGQWNVMGAMTADIYKNITNRCRANVAVGVKAGMAMHDVEPHLTDGQLLEELSCAGVMPKLDLKRIDADMAAARAGQRTKRTAEQLAVCKY